MADLRTPLQAALADRYQLEKELGKGGTAVVFLARDLAHSREVALKVLHPALAETVGADRFKREIRVASRLKHPNILPVFDTGETGDFLWFTMPYVRGASLWELVERREPIPLARSLAITQAVGSALEYAHQQGILHRDIKPENILLEDDQVMVADFGVARAVSEVHERLTATGMIVGTPVYMSPEQASGEELDARTDQYALATVLYEMLSGEAPFKGPTPTATLMRRLAGPPRPLRPVIDVPEAVERAVLRALEKDPAARFASVGDFLDALAGKTVPPRPAPGPPPAEPPRGGTGFLGRFWKKSGG
ncbi:MAG TPA: serine/threonine-protein kinase [Gemmatimonadales bacterium]|nr:serine/threonine-protein kinase [Gemmatimonadales bacterium]